MKLGYTQPLYILPFDHRSSFLAQLLNVVDREPTAEEAETLKDYKHLIYEGFVWALKQGVITASEAAILVDEAFGSAVITEAQDRGELVCVSTEKSGADEFEFEHGSAFGKRLLELKPLFAKALIRYNPEGDQALNKRQQEKLKILSDFCHQHDLKFLIEPLVPATEKQLQTVDNDQARYDDELRPGLVVKMVAELQAAGVEPDVWKIEGFNTTKHYQAIVKQIKSNDRTDVSAIILGRGANDAQVTAWLKAGAKVKGVIGFAVGRTIFWQSLIDYRDQKVSRTEAAEQIGTKFLYFYNLFIKTK